MKIYSAHYIFIKNLLEGGLKKIAIMGQCTKLVIMKVLLMENTPTNPLSLYGIAKNAIRQAGQILCEKYNAVYYWLRAFYIIGDDVNNNSFFRKYVKGKLMG